MARRKRTTAWTTFLKKHGGLGLTRTELSAKYRRRNKPTLAPRTAAGVAVGVVGAAGLLAMNRAVARRSSADDDLVLQPREPTATIPRPDVMNVPNDTLTVDVTPNSRGVDFDIPDGDKIPLSPRDPLAPGRWFRGEDIDAWVEVWTPTARRQSALLTSTGIAFYFSKARTTTDLDSLDNTLPRLSKSRTVLLPVNVGGYHWILLYYIRKDKTIYVYDALQGNNTSTAKGVDNTLWLLGFGRSEVRHVKVPNQ